MKNRKEWRNYSSSTSSVKFGCGKREQTRCAFSKLHSPVKYQPRGPISTGSAFILSMGFPHFTAHKSHSVHEIQLTMQITTMPRLERLSLHSVYCCLPLKSFQISVVHVDCSVAKLRQPWEISPVYAITTRSTLLFANDDQAKIQPAQTSFCLGVVHVSQPSEVSLVHANYDQAGM